MTVHNFSTLFHLLPIGAYRSSPEGILLRANAALLKMLGFSSESELLAASRNGFAATYVLPGRHDQLVELLTAQGQVADFVSEMVHVKTGAHIWVREHAHLIRDGAGNILFYEGTIEDITAKRMANVALQHSESLLRNVLETLPYRVWLKDTDGYYLACNASFAANLGTTAEQIIGTNDAKWLGEDNAKHFAQTDLAAIAAGQAMAYEATMPSPVHADATVYEVIKTPMRDAHGNTIGVLGTARDIQQRKDAEQLLRDTTEELELAIIGADLGRWDHDLTLTKGYCMDVRSCQILGRDAAESTISRTWGHLVHPDDLPATMEAMREHLVGQMPAYEAEYRARHMDGRWVWLSSRGKVVQFSREGKPLRMVGTLMDISARKDADQVIRHLAYHDSLTGLPNRRLFNDRLERAVSSNARHQQHGAVLFLDLDHFKQLNDTQGHDVGDMLLREVAQRLQKSTRAIDTVASLGGDEFVVLIQELSPEIHSALLRATMVSHKILAHLNEPFTLNGHLHTVTPSIGLTLFGSDSPDPKDILKQADSAMYDSKKRGRNTLCVFDPTSDAAPADFARPD